MVHDFAELAARHREALVALSSDQHGIPVAFEERAGMALASAFDDLLAKQQVSGLMTPLADYPEVFQTAFADRMPRQAGPKTRRRAMSASSRCTGRCSPGFIPSYRSGLRCSGPKPLN